MKAKFKILQIFSFFSIATLSFAQEKFLQNSADFIISGDVQSFTGKVKNYTNPNNLVEDPNLIFLDNDPDFTQEYYFNESGNLYKTVQEGQNDYNLKMIYFNNDGLYQKVRRVEFESKQNLKDAFQKDHQLVFEYKKNGVLDITNLFKDGTKETIRRTYDTIGNLIKEQKLEGSKKEINYSYDKMNRPIEQKDNRGNVKKFTYDLDENGDISKKTSTEKDGKVYIYNFKKKLLTSITYPEGYTEYYTYVFDEKGNWTKRTRTLEGKLVTVYFREYVYR